MLESPNLANNPSNFDKEFFLESEKPFHAPETCDFSFNCPDLKFLDYSYLLKEQNNYFNSYQSFSEQEAYINLASENIGELGDSNESNENFKEPNFLNGKNVLFKVGILKKRGRKLEKKKKCHRKEAFDNILVKIQVHFLNFLIDVSNDVMKTICNNNYSHFKQINYIFKRRIAFDHLNRLIKLPIKELFKENISGKYKKCYKTNYEIYSSFAPHNEFIQNFFNMNYLELFEIYYNNCKPLKKIIFEGKEIILSHNTKDFYSLLKKERIIKEKIISVANNVYFVGNNNNNNNNITEKFIIKKTDCMKKDN